tara:strand:+ start:4952 stop:6271 length:1320 start_codon:yes stop_codon:yes gene_type:complete
MPTIQELREQRADLIMKAQQLNDEHTDADGLLPSEYQTQFDAMLDDAQEIGSQVERLDKLSKVQADSLVDEREAEDSIIPGASANANNNRIPYRTNRTAADGKPHYVDQPAGARGTNEYKETFATALSSPSSHMRPEQVAALQSDNSEAAGYLVASEQFASELLKEVDDLLFVRQFARVHTVPTAGSLGIRARTAKMSTFNWSSELTVSTSDSALKYGKRVLTPHHLTGGIEVSRDLVRRLGGLVESEVLFEASRDSGEVMEDAYLTGSGSQQPLGVFTASTDGISTSRDVATGSATSITFDGLVDAKYSLKSQYRNGGVRAGARWLFHRDAVKIICKLKDSDGQPLMRPGRGLLDDDPDTILGMPFDESERCPNTFTSGQYVGLLGNWRYYEIADALDLEVQVLFELYAATSQIGYIFRIKTDGMPTLEEAFARLKTD